MIVARQPQYSLLASRESKAGGGEGLPGDLIPSDLHDSPRLGSLPLFLRHPVNARVAQQLQLQCRVQETQAQVVSLPWKLTR